MPSSRRSRRPHEEHRRRAFLDVYDGNVWLVYAFFAYRTGSRLDAEDLTQTTFERALRAWDRYDAERSQPATWLLAIARNLLIDHRRRAEHQRTEPRGDIAALREASEATQADMSGIGPDASLEAALTQLGEREREIVALRFGGDLTGAQIAEITDLTVANVQQILSRALRKLRSELERTDAAPNQGTPR